MSPLYVYAVLAETPEGPLPEGLAGERLRLVSCGGVLAAVGEVAGAPPLDAEALRAHDRTVRELAAGSFGLLPARFGSLSSDEASLCASLQAHQAALRSALDAVRGCEQMTLRMWWSEGGPPERVPDEALPESSLADAGAAGPGRRFLEARRARWDKRQSVPEVARVLQALAALRRSERVEWHDRPPLVASVFHLVPSGTAEAYRRAVAEAVAEEPRLRVSVTGPWPPYAFAPAELA
jgi:hypothetical protein